MTCEMRHLMCERTIDFFQVSRRTIYNWMNDWEDKRLLGLYNQTGRGRKPTFNEEQKQKIKSWVKLYPKDLKKVLAQIKEEWEITVSKDTIKIEKRNENLDISWLRDESLQSGDNLPEPEIIAAEIMEKLRIATKEMAALIILLEGEEAAEAVSAAVGLSDNL
ncbi:helix-turn-helix domain-containing protein [Cuspidothrix issatschenkoi]|uniref:helix-turn-helix domain-containing protein n=1 Tax=Cuspidothrix issatschenkoi TaxID=230752 RepID=UPI001D14F779|nr:helix-turn-helix domain-containing protein [Cuspidothrix issatschenkoi]